MQWPFDKRLDAAHAWGIAGVGFTALVALPGLLALEHTKGPFLVWWPTDWMAVPVGVFTAGVVLLFLPIRKSKAQLGQGPDTAITTSGGAGTASQGNLRKPVASVPVTPTAIAQAPVALGSVSLAGELADLLAAIPEMAEPGFRERVYEGVPRVVMQQVRRSDKARLDMLSVAQTFETYAYLRPWQALLRQLQEILPGNPYVARLAARLDELGLGGNGGTP
jgi:hypothetical protein